MAQKMVMKIVRPWWAAALAREWELQAPSPQRARWGSRAAFVQCAGI